jgi:hypothetical protein
MFVTFLASWLVFKVVDVHCVDEKEVRFPTL